MKVYTSQISTENSHRLFKLKEVSKRPMTKIINSILDQYFNGQLKEVTQMKITEVEVMVSKKVTRNYDSCCISFSARATLDESEDYLNALNDLKGQLVGKVQESLKPGNGHNNGDHTLGNGKE